MTEVKRQQVLKHVAIRHDGMLTIVPDVVTFSTQQAGEELVGPGHVQTWSTSYVTITRASGNRFTLDKVAEVNVIFSRSAKEQE
jgi:hypothetical protein